jgi:tetratricopeptide (TPR) repeat protein
MLRAKQVVAALVFGCVAAGAAAAPMDMGPRRTLAQWAQGAQLFDGLGDFHRKITTRSAPAQAYFDQGMRFLWAFNHDEATRSFAKAAELDPQCAACLWGVALTLGPNYNMPMMAQARAGVGWQALQRAQQAAAAATPVEQALIQALAQRFDGPSPLDPVSGGPKLAAYADAMKLVAERFPDDLDVQTLYAEALMNKNPWKLWTADGQPAPGTAEIVATLERVLAKDPLHPGANHYYIHAVEASPHPEKALVAAQRVGAMMPAAGHLVHMPSHILQRVGQYEGSAQANRSAAAADVAYYAKTRAPDYYPMYTAHNYQFLAYSAAMEGRRAETLAALRQARTVIPDEMLAGMPGADWSLAYLYAAMIRFGLWDEALAEPAPSAKLPGLRVGYFEARSQALAAKGRLEDAEAAARELDQAAAGAPADYACGMSPAKTCYAISSLRAQARIALARRQPERAAGLLGDAVAKEDTLDYDEPADAFFPTRHLLGAALMAAGRPGEAEAVYRQDLKRNPENGWALYGLKTALEAQGRTADAQDAGRRFAAAWNRADVTLSASAY